MLKNLHQKYVRTLDRKCRASGKPSTWFPLESLVQKAFSNTRAFYFIFQLFLNFYKFLVKFEIFKKNSRWCSSSISNVFSTFSSCNWSFMLWKIFILVTRNRLLSKIFINVMYFFVNFTLARSTENFSTSWHSILM